MSEFEYITVLLSILIGLGVTQLLSGIARLVRDGRALWPAWWVMVIVATLLLGNVQVWWASFIWRHQTSWTFFGYLSFLVQPVILYLLAYLVLPADLHLDGRELAHAFVARRKPFFVLLALIAPASLMQQWVLRGVVPPFDLDTAFRLMWIVIAVPGYFANRARVQAMIAVASFAMLTIYIALLFTRIG